MTHARLRLAQLRWLLLLPTTASSSRSQSRARSVFICPRRARAGAGTEGESVFPLGDGHDDSFGVFTRVVGRGGRCGEKQVRDVGHLGRIAVRETSQGARGDKENAILAKLI